MCRNNFRVRVDLSKLYDDVRRFSWVYVDSNETSRICHLQKRITKIFDVKKHFYLLLDEVYLPPDEDARILKEDETIIVVPGVSLQQPGSNPPKTISELEPVKNTTSRGILQQNQPAADSFISPKNRQNESSDEEAEVSAAMETTNENTVFFSMINDSLMEGSAKSESKPDTSTYHLEETLPEPETSPLKNKRKRVRRNRKSKSNLTSGEDQSVVNTVLETDHKKPKIMNSVTIPNGKHIRFGEVEELEFQEYDSSVSDSKNSDIKSSRNGKEDSYWEKPAAGSSSNLSNLLALRQSSTPITFSRKKNCPEFSSPSNNETKEHEAKENGAKIGQKFQIDNQGWIVDHKKHPLMENKARVNDVMAFKMLKMGNDYTPQLSEYIIAHVIDIMADKSTFVFKILGGINETQPPQGKFDIETDETKNTETDIITLNWPQLIEPRLIYRE